jgi:hypothetical protein
MHAGLGKTAESRIGSVGDLLTFSWKERIKRLRG